MPIDYHAMRPDHRDLIALVPERGYGLAHGPKGNIKYLGVFGSDRTIAVGLVFDQAKGPPRLAVGLFSGNVDWGQSVSSMLRGINAHKSLDKSVRVYIASAEPRPDEMRYNIGRSFFAYFSFHNFLDYGNEHLVLDLMTGRPVDSLSCRRLYTCGLAGEVYAERGIDAREVIGKTPLTLDFDMQKGIPKGLVIHPNDLNPIKDIRLES